MFRRLLLLVFPFYFMLLLSFSASGQESAVPSLSPQASISLLTCGPGDALFEAFGHSAIRVNDPVNGIDKVYNYGVFDFNQPNFYLNFAKGDLRYKLGTADFSEFLYSYIYFNRSVQEQVLQLSPSQKQAVYQFLEINSLPQYQYYYYDYFFDNCATRPRDVFISVLGDSLQFDYSYADKFHYTIRGLIDRYIEEPDQYAWGDFGIDLGLGARIDRLATPFEYMYQPEFLAAAFSGATVVQPDGSTRPLLLSTSILFEASPVQNERDILFTPTVLFWLLLVLVACGTAWDFWRRQRIMQLFDLAFFAFVGLLGALLVFLWFFTNHTAAADNWNVAWAWPTHFFAAMFLVLSPRPRWVKLYFLLAAIGAGLLLLLWPVVPQDLHEALIPVLLIIIIRSAFNSLIGVAK